MQMACPFSLSLSRFSSQKNARWHEQLFFLSSLTCVTFFFSSWLHYFLISSIGFSLYGRYSKKTIFFPPVIRQHLEACCVNISQHRLSFSLLLNIAFEPRHDSLFRLSGGQHSSSTIFIEMYGYTFTYTHIYIYIFNILLIDHLDKNLVGPREVIYIDILMTSWPKWAVFCIHYRFSVHLFSNYGYTVIWRLSFIVQFDLQLYWRSVVPIVGLELTL